MAKSRTVQKKPSAPIPVAKEPEKNTVVEISWEVCNQVGGIYTVIRSKVPAMTGKWHDDYFLIGPYFAAQAHSEFEESGAEDSPVARTVGALQAMGIGAYYGRWLVTGNPRVVLIDVVSVLPKLAEIKYFYWEHHGIQFKAQDELTDQVVCFGYCVHQFFARFYKEDPRAGRIIAHFHEWLSAAAIPRIRRDTLPLRVVFTTHATLLGRYIASANPVFYEQLSGMHWEKEAEGFGIQARVLLERAAAHGAHCFTTVSEVTARECVQFLGRKPDVITPNGLNIERFVALHEFQNLHLEYKKMITRFVMGHFFPSYGFDLEKTLYFFTSGRYEYRNKGFDLTLDALHLLNQRMKKEATGSTVIMFFITKRPFHTINPEVLSERAMFEEVRNTCNSMLQQAQDRLLHEVTRQPEARFPVLNDFVDDYWKLRLRRTLASWKTKRLPIVVTHNLVDDHSDEILQYIRRANFVNNEYDPVKIVYHPDFISPVSPLFGMDYGHFVRGCHLGIFPSAYEPWGYTPMECIANGIPAVTSDFSGFGDFVQRTMSDHNENGIWVVGRRGKSYSDAVSGLADILHAFVKLTRRERITQRNAVENRSASFDWHNMLPYYEQAYGGRTDK